MRCVTQSKYAWASAAGDNPAVKRAPAACSERSMMSASAVTAKESRASIWLAGLSCADGIRSAGTSAAAGKGRKTVPAGPRTLSGAGFDEIAAAVSVARPAAMRSTPSLRPLKVNYFRSRAGQHDLNQSVRCAFGQRADVHGSFADHADQILAHAPANSIRELCKLAPSSDGNGVT